MSELRRVYTSVDARDRIMEAALTVFANCGFAGATTREIAKEAGVSSGLIHHHFKDKENLWKLVGERISSEFQEAISASGNAASVGTPDGMKAMFAAYLQYWRRHPKALRFQLWRVLGAPEDERRARSKHLNGLFVPVIKAAQDAGHIRADIPAGLAMVTVGGLIQYFLHSDVETRDALAVTKAAPFDDAKMLDYLWRLVAADKHASAATTRKRKPDPK